MAREENHRDGPRPVRRTAWVLPLAALGLALFLSSMWTARADASHISTAVVYTTRIVSFATYMVMAWVFRNHLPQVRLLLGIAASSMLVHLVCALAGPWATAGLDASVATTIVYLSALFEGVANALMTLLFAHVFSSFRPKRSAVALGAAFMGVDVCILVLDTMSSQVIYYARPLFTLLAVVILLCVGRALLSVNGTAPASSDASAAAPGPASADHGLQYGMARPGGEEERPFTFFSAHTDWLLLIIAAFLFPSLFGVIAQVSSETGGNFALYDIPTEIVMIALQALFLLFLGACGTRFGFSAILAFVVPLFATGFALFPGNWAAGNPFAGCLIRGGYVILFVMLWVLMARKSYDDPRHTYLYFGILCGISNAQAGRLLGSFLMRDTGPNLALCQGISLWALWCICIFGLVLFFLLQRGGLTAAFGALETLEPGPDADVGARDAEGIAGATTSRASGAPGAAPVGAPAVPSAGNLGVDAFSAQFEAFSARVRLTPREHEVVAEALHGYSRTSIAKKLCLSPETVKTYLNRAYAKAQVTSKQELIAAIELERL